MKMNCKTKSGGGRRGDQIGNILERISDGFVAFDADMNYTYVNARGGEMLGRKPADLIGKNHWKEYPEAKGSTFANAYLRALKEQAPLEIEDYYQPFDRWFENRIYPSKDGLSIFFHDITDRKKAELALEERERLFSAIAETTPALIYVYDMETQSNVYANAGIEQILGYSPRQVRATGDQVFARLIHPDDLPAVIEFQSRVMSIADGEILEIEYRMKDSNGQWHDLHSYERAFMRNANGSLKQKLGVAMDVTERKRVDEKLRISEERFSKAFFISPAGITITRIADGKFVDANDSFLQLFEFSRAEVIGHTSTELNMWTPEERKKLIQQQLASGGLRDFELQARSKSGGIKNILFSSKPIELEGETHHITTMIDITERKRAAEELKSNERRFRAVVENAWDTVLFVSPEGIATYVSPSIERVLGYSSSEIIGRNGFELVHPEDLAQAQAMTAHELAHPAQAFTFELRMLHKNGDWRTLEISAASYLHDAAVGAIVANMRDITERKRAEEQLRESETKFRQIAENIENVLWFSNLAENRMAYISPAYEKVWGNTCESLYREPRSFLENMLAEDLEVVTDSLNQQLVGLKTDVTYRIQNPEKGMRWIRDRGFPLVDATGKVSNVVGIAEDITERKQAEEAVLKSEEQLRLILDGLGPGIFVGLMDVEGTLLIANKPALQAAALRAEDVIGKSFVDTYWWAYSDVVQQRLRSAIQRAAQGEPARYDELVRGAEEEHIWIDFSLHPLQDGDGNVIFIVPSANVITERKRAESERERLLSVLEASLNEIYIFDPDSLKFRYVNQGAIRNLGYTFEQLTQMTPLGFKPEFTETSFRDMLAPLLRREKEKHIFQTVHRRLDGSLYPVEVHLQFVETTGERLFLAIILDITERKRAEEELRLHRDRLRELSRQLVQTHETESRAIGRELHDQIGQMLTALKLIMEIAPQLPPEPAAKKFAQAHDLVDDLLNRVSRLSLELRPPMLDDLGLIPALLWHINRYQEQTNIAVDFKHSGAEGKRFGNEIETTAYRVVQESLTNVARHAHATRARLEVRVEADVMKIQIEDNGAGFDPQAAFDKQRGLSGMRERVNLLGGSFRIESQPGKGAKKTIQLPLREKTT